MFESSHVVAQREGWTSEFLRIPVQTSKIQFWDNLVTFHSTSTWRALVEADEIQENLIDRHTPKTAVIEEGNHNCKERENGEPDTQLNAHDRRLEIESSADKNIYNRAP